MDEIVPFVLDVPESDITDLKTRLSMTKWPEAETVSDWSQGVPIQYHRDFCEYWAKKYDWYSTQERLNRFNQYETVLDGIKIHLSTLGASSRMLKHCF